MKNFTRLLFVTAVFSFVLLYSCQKEETPKRKPTVTATPGTIEGENGEKFTITVNWSAEAGIAVLTSSSPDVSVPLDLTGSNGTFETEYTLGAEDETYNLYYC
ncbi:MAG: hypothetical protein ACUZ8I_12095 [Candidatus Scalindua sp.]